MTVNPQARRKPAAWHAQLVAEPLSESQNIPYCNSAEFIDAVQICEKPLDEILTVRPPLAASVRWMNRLMLRSMPCASGVRLSRGPVFYAQQRLLAQAAPVGVHLVTQSTER
jgi:hypothetical protein